MLATNYVVTATPSLLATTNACGCGTISGNLALVVVEEVYTGEGGDTSTSVEQHWCCRACVQATLEQPNGRRE